MSSSLLGGLAPRDFLRRHWQKRPLFVPAALPQVAGMPRLRELRALAARDDVESRIVQRRGDRWNATPGPFSKASLGTKNSSLLVSGVNLHVAAADRLLRRFDFIPQARLDDVMVSYATPGGGVGPHVDSYDVFLIQGIGVRRWKVWNLKGKAFQLVANPGDLLYLPPGWKHDGVALEECTTWSVGFRAPRGAELAAAFLDYLHERGLPDAGYRDPELKVTPNPGRVPEEMIRFSELLLKKIRWRKADVTRFLGEYLTQPKPHVVFRPRLARGTRLRLDAKSQLLYSGPHFFLNGETVPVPARARRAMREFADRREIKAVKLAAIHGMIGEWRRAGYAHLGNRDD
jgi:50S ribosomal protein L16 3-hydroxylase